jgi:outer membrane protein OmpA-like peptidoglycan-associated protein
MNKIILLFGVLLFNHTNTNAQVINRKARETADKASQRVDNKASQGIDKGLDKVEEGIGNIFKKKEKKKKEANAATQTKTDTVVAPASYGANTSTAVKKNSKFDFEPGNKVIQFDDFNRLSIGDFPAEYNSNTSGEVVNIPGKNGKWLSLTKNGCIVPDYTNKLPENFTLEFELGINTDPSNNYSGFGLNFSVDKANLMKDMFFNAGNAVIYLHPGAATASVFVNPIAGSEITNDVQMPEWDVREGSNKNFTKVSVWRQKGRLRIYVNENKVFDVPRFFVETASYSFAFFRSFFGDCEVYVTNIRYAIAGEDLRARLMKEGKFSTTGITFDINSDKIKTESKAVLDEIGSLLQTNADIKLKIVGHTDNDGDAAANIILSQKRAVAIKTTLVNNYGIDAGRLITEGKGETEALNTNTTAAEKAANRRVEFVKF